MPWPSRHQHRQADRHYQQHRQGVEVLLLAAAGKAGAGSLREKPGSTSHRRVACQACQQCHDMPGCSLWVGDAAMKHLAAASAVGPTGLALNQLLLGLIVSTQGQQETCTGPNTCSVIGCIKRCQQSCKIKQRHQSQPSTLCTCCCRLVCGQRRAAVKHI